MVRYFDSRIDGSAILEHCHRYTHSLVVITIAGAANLDNTSTVVAHMCFGRRRQDLQLCQLKHGSGGFNNSGFGTSFVVTVQMVHSFIKALECLAYESRAGRACTARSNLLERWIPSEHGGVVVAASTVDTCWG